MKSLMFNDCVKLTTGYHRYIDLFMLKSDHCRTLYNVAHNFKVKAWNSILCT